MLGQLADQLLDAALGELSMVGRGQPCLLVGDFNVEPTKIPCPAREILAGLWVDLEEAWAFAAGLQPLPTSKRDWDSASGHRQDFMVGCPLAVAAVLSCKVQADWWIAPHLAVRALFDRSWWTCRVTQPVQRTFLWSASWLSAVDKGRGSKSVEVQSVWEIHDERLLFMSRHDAIQLDESLDVDDVSRAWLVWSGATEAALADRGSKSADVQTVSCICDDRLHFMTRDDALGLNEALEGGDVSRAWSVWSSAAEAALADAHQFAGGPVPERGLVLGRGFVVARAVRLGGPYVRKARGNFADPHEGGDVFMYHDASAAVLLDLRCRFKAVGDVFHAMIRDGVTLARSLELTVQWDGIIRIGPVYPLTVKDFEMAKRGGLGEWLQMVEGLHRRRSDFIQRVVVHRREEAIRGWRNWLREDPLVHTYRWLRLDLVPPAPFLQGDPLITPGGSGVPADPTRIDEEFRKAWLPYFCRSGQREASLDEFNREVDGWLPLLLEVHLPRLTGQVLADVVHRKSATAGSLDGWGWRELKVLHVSWFDELARILTLVEDNGVWPDGLLDAYIAMIPKTDGDAAPLGQRPLSVLPVVYRIWASTRMVQLEIWFKSWVPDSVFSTGCVVGRLRLGMLLLLILRRFFLVLLILMFIFCS